MERKKTYLMPALRTTALGSEVNFLATGTGEDADPKNGSWLFEDEFDLY
ncbi:MAG: hypothetical protein J6W74_04230 [Bacteroidales bacterium]|nr:hypothetical protein [Bacteroidales bacterium]